MVNIVASMFFGGISGSSTAVYRELTLKEMWKLMERSLGLCLSSTSSCWFLE